MIPARAIGILYLALFLSVASARSAHGQEKAAESTVDESAIEAPADVLERRRAALLDRMDAGVALIRSADPRELSAHPQDSDFRQNNDFYYLTGQETPESWLVLWKPASGEAGSTLYVPEPSSRRQLWTGPLPSLEEVARSSGIEAVRPSERFEKDVVALLTGGDSLTAYERVYLPLGDDDEVAGLAALAKGAGHTIVDVRAQIAALRMVKDSVELARLRRAVTITEEALRTAMATVSPGMFEYELEAVIEYVFRASGAERVAFPSIVGSGPNSVVLHYDENRRRMEDGDLVVMDVGAEFGYYAADITRTIPIAGTFDERQRALYELVLATQQAVIDSIGPGLTIWDLERIARRHLRERSDGLCGDATCDRFLLHGVSHWLGMNVHDVGSYRAPLEPGMVLTVEPGIYLVEEGLGIRIEDDVLVTREGAKVLSSGAPRSVEEVERAMQAPCSGVDSALALCRE